MERYVYSTNWKIRINVKNDEYDRTPTIQKCYTDTKLNTESLNNNEKETVFDKLNNVGLYDKRHTKDINSARMKDALYILPKLKTEILNLPVPAIEKIEICYEEITEYDLVGRGIENIITLSNINDIKDRLEVSLCSKLSGHSHALKEASTLLDELHKRREIKKL